MAGSEQIQRTQRLVFGLLLVALGVLFLLHRLELTDIGSLGDLWPLFLAAIGLVKVLQPAGSPGRGFGAILIVVGVWWTLDNLELVRYGVFDFWPALLILGGLGLLWRGLGRRSADAPVLPARPPAFGENLTLEEPLPPAPTVAAPSSSAGADTESGTVHMVALLGGMARRCSSQAFTGGEATAVMGGCELDLRHAETATGRAVLNVFALWGGIEIRVPPHWAVAIEGVPIMASIEDTRPASGVPPRSTLVVRGAAIMAGVEIKS